MKTLCELVDAIEPVVLNMRKDPVGYNKFVGLDDFNTVKAALRVAVGDVAQLKLHFDDEVSSNAHVFIKETETKIREILTNGSGG